MAAVPRILTAFLLPNAFGDAYAYIRDIGLLSEKISSRTIGLGDLYGFWLPLYQFICALISAVAGHPYYVGKLVSAVFGAGICLLIYDLTWRLTGHRTAAMLAFLLIALNPLHIFNSGSAMTDIPNAFFVVASAYFALRSKWIAAAIFAALAGLTRVDSWMLIALLPAIQLLRERRVSIVGLLITLLPPAFWFFLGWKTTGDWLACFVTRKQYMDALLASNPSLASFSPYGVARDVGSLLVATSIPVLIASSIAAGIALKQIVRRRKSEELHGVITVCVFFFAFFSFIVLAYLTHKQPIIFPRYGLIDFALGIPLLPWAYLRITQNKSNLKRKLLTAIVVICVFEATVQAVGSVGFINKQNTHGKVGEYLRVHFQATTGAHIFSDDGTVVALSGLPGQVFLSSTDAPLDREHFIAFLTAKHVDYLVWVEKQDSTVTKLFPELRNGAGNELFQPEMHATARFLRADLWVYRVRIEAEARP